jgi:predicted nucleic acid-binding protein
VTYLLNVNLLLAALWSNHSLHLKADEWLKGKEIALCPLSELGFLRISTNPHALGAAIADAKKLLKDFKERPEVTFIADDLSASAINPRSSDEVTYIYLATLADHHGMKLATLDTGISHPSVELIS